MNSGSAMLLGLVVLAAAPAVAKTVHIPVKPPANVVTDPSLAAFRADLAKVAKARDLKQLGPLVGPTFFWERDFGGGYSPKATPLANLTAALSLDDSKLDPEYRGVGWKRLASIAASTMFVQAKYGGDEHGKGAVMAVCGPTPPSYAHGAIPDELTYGYVLGRAEVRAKPSPDAKVISSLENEAVEILEPASEEIGHADFAKVKLPDGKSGYVAAEAIHGFLEEELCVAKLKPGWRIVGYIGGGD
jgi:hypothetical protein